MTTMNYFGDLWSELILHFKKQLINQSINGDVIVILPGIHREYINFHNKTITLTSIDPSDSAIVSSTIIDGNVNPISNNSGFNDHTTVRIGSGAKLSGLTITGGSTGIRVEHGSPTISNCIIIQNSNRGSGGGVFIAHNTSPSFFNCVIRAHSKRAF